MRWRLSRTLPYSLTEAEGSGVNHDDKKDTYGPRRKSEMTNVAESHVQKRRFDDFLPF